MTERQVPDERLREMAAWETKYAALPGLTAEVRSMARELLELRAENARLRGKLHDLREEVEDLQTANERFESEYE
jgi:predicted nuclease with TOPRIM domain